MPASIRHESDDIYVLRISGTLLRSEFGDAGAAPRILAILEDFEGFEPSAHWGDLEFLFSHSNEIARIAIVGDPRLEVSALAFAGAGHRRAPVQFFRSDQEAQARVSL